MILIGNQTFLSLRDERRGQRIGGNPMESSRMREDKGELSKMSEVNNVTCHRGETSAAKRGLGLQKGGNKD